MDRWFPVAVLRCIWIIVHVTFVTSSTVVYQVVEEQPPPVVIGNLASSDHEGDDVTYTLLNPGENGELFHLDVKTGTLQTAARVDRDTLCPNAEHCFVDLTIAVRGTQFSFISVQIEILDINDNAPVFNPDHISREVAETQAPGKLFPIQPAVDPDSPANSSITYELDPESNIFRLQMNQSSSNGWVDLQLSLLTVLDREVTDAYEIRILARDSGNPELTGTMSVQIVIQDVNDHRPVFDHGRYNITIPEDTTAGSKLTQVRATDRDTGINGQLRYSFTGKTEQRYGSLFSIDSENGEIRLRESLDHESQTSFVLIVEARDSGAGSVAVTTSVYVFVQDINDNIPSILVEDPHTGQPFEDLDAIHILEHSEGPLAVVTVSDPDSGENGLVTCHLDDTSLLEMTSIFDGVYGLRSKADLDRELVERYVIEITCFDQGSPSRTSSVGLTFLIDDANDNTPVFTKDVYYVRVAEDIPKDTFIVQVRASDPDAGSNGQIVYSLDEITETVFQIHAEAGVITSKVNLDRETKSEYTFNVTATDSAIDGSRTARAQVVVAIVDVDDERPQFTKRNFQFRVSENLPRETEVDQVSAVDRDLPPYNDFTFHLENQDGTFPAFYVHPKTGVLFTTRILDREEVGVYHLVVVVESDDNPGQRDTAMVTVTVDDINDNAPSFLFPTNGSVSILLNADSPLGYQVTQIQAEDPDEGPNGEISFSITPGAENEEFIIHPQSGEIFVHKDLSAIGNSTAFDLVITASDNGEPRRESQAFVSIVMNSTVAADVTATQSSADNLTLILVCTVLGFALVTTALVVAIVVVNRRSRLSKLFWIFCPKRLASDPYARNPGDVSRTNEGYVSDLEGSYNCRREEEAREQQRKVTSQTHSSGDGHQVVSYQNAVSGDVVSSHQVQLILNVDGEATATDVSS